MRTGKFTAIPGAEEGYSLLRYSWKDGETRRAVEYKILENICTEEAASELEKFAALLREKSVPISYGD